MNILKKIIKSIIVLIVIIFIIWAALVTFVQSERGQAWMMDRVVSYVEKQTQSEVKIKKVEFLLPFKLRIHNIEIHKDKALLLSAETFDVSCLSPKLLNGDMDCSYLYGKGIRIPSHPLLTSSTSQSDTSTLKTLMSMNIKIRRFFFEDIAVDDAVRRKFIPNSQIDAYLENFIFSIQGSLNSKQNKPLYLHVNLKGTSTLHAPFELQIDSKDNILELFFSGEEIEYDHKKFSLSTRASGITETWFNLFNNHDFIEPLKGNVRIKFYSHTNPIYTLLTNEMIIQTRFEWEKPEKINFFNTTLNSPHAFINGEFIYNFVSIEQGRFEGEIYNTAPFKKLYSSFPILDEGKIQGTFSGPIKNLATDFEFMTSQVVVNEFKFDNIHLKTSSVFFENNLSGNLQINFLHKKIPFAFSTNYHLKEKTFEMNQINGSTQDTTLNGEISVSVQDLMTHGHLQIISKDIEKFSSLFSSSSIKGRLDLTLDFIKSENQSLSFHLVGENFDVFNQLHADSFTADLKIDDLWSNASIIESTIEADLVKYLDYDSEKIFLTINQNSPITNEGNAHFFIKNFSSPQGSLKELKGESTFNFNQMPSSFSLKVKGHDNIFFTTSGDWTYKQNDFVAHINQFSGQFRESLFGLRSPFSVNIQPQKELVILKDLDFFLGNGAFKGELSLEKNTIDSHFEGIRIPSELLHFVAPEVPITGLFSFDSHLKGSLHSPQGKIVLTLHHIQITEDIFTTRPFIEGEVVIETITEGFAIQGSLYGIGKRPVIIKGSIPINLSLLPFSFSLNKKSPFEIGLQAEGELDPYLQLFYNDTYNLTGQTKINLVFSGLVESPKIEGKITIYDGMYESFSTGAIYKNISAELEADGKEIHLKNLVANDTRHGTITASGKLILDSINHYPFNFHIQPQQIYIIDDDHSNLTASGSLYLVGNQQKRSLQGELTIDEASLRMEQALPAQIKTVDLKYINLNGESDPFTQQVHWPLELDIKAHLPGNVHITSKNLNSEWKGFIEVTGFLSNPLYWGELRVVKGDYNLNGKKFALTQGNIYFAGPVEKKTTLYAVLSKEIGKYNTEIIVKGPTNKLKFNFRSNPSLSQREVLSYILFGRGVSDITSNQGDVLSQSFMELNSTDSSSNQTDLLTRLRNKIGIDQLDISTNDSANTGDVSVQVGKYIHDDVKVSVNRSINAASNRVSVEAKLHKNWQAQAEVGDDAQGKVMVKWKKDY